MEEVLIFLPPCGILMGLRLIPHTASTSLLFIPSVVTPAMVVIVLLFATALLLDPILIVYLYWWLRNGSTAHGSLNLAYLTTPARLCSSRTEYLPLQWITLIWSPRPSSSSPAQLLSFWLGSETNPGHTLWILLQTSTYQAAVSDRACSSDSLVSLLSFPWPGLSQSPQPSCSASCSSLWCILPQPRVGQASFELGRPAVIAIRMADCQSRKQMWQICFSSWSQWAVAQVIVRRTSHMLQEPGFLRKLLQAPLHRWFITFSVLDVAGIHWGLGVGVYDPSSRILLWMKLTNAVGRPSSGTFTWSTLKQLTSLLGKMLNIISSWSGVNKSWSSHTLLLSQSPDSLCDNMQAPIDHLPSFFLRTLTIMSSIWSLCPLKWFSRRTHASRVLPALSFILPVLIGMQCLRINWSKVLSGTPAWFFAMYSSQASMNRHNSFACPGNHGYGILGRFPEPGLTVSMTSSASSVQQLDMWSFFSSASFSYNAAKTVWPLSSCSTKNSNRGTGSNKYSYFKASIYLHIKKKSDAARTRKKSAREEGGIYNPTGKWGGVSLNLYPFGPTHQPTDEERGRLQSQSSNIEYDVSGFCLKISREKAI